MWTRPDDYLTDDDYPFDYRVCIKKNGHNLCDVAVKTLHYTFQGLSSNTEHEISIQAKSQEMMGDQAYLTASTTAGGK